MRPQFTGKTYNQVTNYLRMLYTKYWNRFIFDRVYPNNETAFFRHSV